MTDTVIIYLPHSRDGAEKIAGFLHADMRDYSKDVFAEVFRKYRKIIALMSIGIVVRQISTLLSNKWEDPAVVAVSPAMTHAVPILGGHHGANTLAKKLAGLGISPVITTATDALGKESVEGIAEHLSCEIVNRDSTRAVNAAMLEADVPIYTIPGPAILIAGPKVSILMRRGEYVIGIGCRKGTASKEVLYALERALLEARIEPWMVLTYATTERKRNEAGMRDAVSSLSGNMIFLDDQTINAQPVSTSSKAEHLGLRGVAEPCALALSKHKELVMNKRVYGSVTIAIAR